jgi:hypothetical protein
MFGGSHDFFAGRRQADGLADEKKTLKRHPSEIPGWIYNAGF